MQYGLFSTVNCSVLWSLVLYFTHLKPFNNVVSPMDAPSSVSRALTNTHIHKNTGDPVRFPM